MEIANKVLDILFRRIDPEEVLAYLDDRRQPGDLPSLFMAKAETMLSGYSYEEKENAFRYLFPRSDNPPDGNVSFRLWWSRPVQFDLLARSADRMLITGGNGPFCRYPETLEWRDAYLLLGQDIFTTSLLAYESKTRPMPKWFSWPAIVPVDNPVLNALCDGLAENHMHLKAGASTFSLTWACLMNHPDAIIRHDRELGVLLQPRFSRATANAWSNKRRILYAAYIRMLLFLRVQGEEENIVPAFLKFHRGYTTDPMVSREVKSRADAVRFVHGVPFTQPDTLRDVCLDYAFSWDLANQRDEHSRLLAGERRLLYECFYRAFCGTLSESEQWLFYVYLLLKTQFRSELVQVNRQTGFHNFHDYDRRKSLFWQNEYPEYLNEDYRQTINANVSEQRISALEGRVCPGNTAFENVSYIHEIDRAWLFYDRQLPSERLAAHRWRAMSGMKNMAEESDHFYVLHFPKRADSNLHRRHNMAPVCRHYEFRKGVRIQALALASALSNSDYLCHRVRGIDACSSELVCRPEVFAEAFRFLCSFPVEHYRLFPFATGTPKLSITYHVGEDFLDIADGLRAVDEAVRLLGLRRGDRIGHATVLGVDPQLHYDRKSRQSFMTKQEALDTFVWIYYRSGELNVRAPLATRQKLFNRATALFDEIYRSRTSIPGATLRDYYLSMRLRGDDPRCYETGRFKPPSLRDGFDMHCIDNNDDDLFGGNGDGLYSLRCRSRIAELCFLYHYCHGANNDGAMRYQFTIDDEYILLMGDLQKAMRRFVNDRGISVECNPSSNVLIGTFGSYQKHPILTLNSTGLGIEKADTQMHVSINTDDPGVFDTSLTFEYALLACALQKMTNEDGERVNDDRAIEEYLRSVVRMGREQVFPPDGRGAGRQTRSSARSAGR